MCADSEYGRGDLGWGSELGNASSQSELSPIEKLMLSDSDINTGLPGNSPPPNDQNSRIHQDPSSILNLTGDDLSSPRLSDKELEILAGKIH